MRKTVHAKLLLNLCFALLGLYVTFIISTVSTGVPVLCGVVSALMHYFFLAVFFWMAAEAIQLHRKLVTVFKPDITSYVTIAMAICWGRLVHVERESNTHYLCTILPSCTILPLQWFLLSLWCSPWLHITRTTFIHNCKEFQRMLHHTDYVQYTKNLFCSLPLYKLQLPCVWIFLLYWSACTIWCHLHYELDIIHPHFCQSAV